MEQTVTEQLKTQSVHNDQTANDEDACNTKSTNTHNELQRNSEHISTKQTATNGSVKNGTSGRRWTRTEDSREVEWRFLGRYEELKQVRCRRVHASQGSRHDVALFYDNLRFYAMSAWCSHMGGPLFEGQIEEYNDKCHVMCPWHAYMFELDSGKNELGLEQTVFSVKIVDDNVYVKHASELSLLPYL